MSRSIPLFVSIFLILRVLELKGLSQQKLGDVSFALLSRLVQLRAVCMRSLNGHRGEVGWCTRHILLLSSVQLVLHISVL